MGKFQGKKWNIPTNSHVFTTIEDRESSEILGLMGNNRTTGTEVYALTKDTEVTSHHKWCRSSKKMWYYEKAGGWFTLKNEYTGTFLTVESDEKIIITDPFLALDYNAHTKVSEAMRYFGFDDIREYV